ncbi:MAG: response regulator [Suipraeoptans sp.]
MYKILLVDDEILVREAIREKIRWNDLGFELVADLENGKEAQKFVENNLVDLVLTDIYMPYMDGLELSKFLYENYPDIAIVIFSGYSDFEYAKRAIQYKVSEYILKPVTAIELSEILIKVKEKLDSKKNEEEKLDELKKVYHTYTKNESAIISKTLTKLVNGTESVEKSLHELSELGVKIKASSYRVAVIDIDVYSDLYGISEELKKESALMAFVVENIASEVLNKTGEGIAFRDNDNRTYMLFYTKKVKELRHHIIETCTKVQELVNETTGLSVSLGIGTYVDDIHDLKVSYNSAMEALKHRFSRGDGHIFDAEQTINYEQMETEEEFYNMMYLSLKNRTIEEVEMILDSISDSMKKYTISKSVIIAYLHRLQRLIYETISEKDMSFKLTDNDVNTITQMKSLDAAMTFLKEYAREGLVLLADITQSSTGRQADLAINYLNNNYDNAGLSLNEVCNYLGISSSYFSSFFKDETGSTFLEMLTNIRMGKAKELLTETSLRNYEIAERVGYSDPHYFNIAFKKVVGVTPKEFARERRDEKKI